MGLGESILTHGGYNRGIAGGAVDFSDPAL